MSTSKFQGAGVKHIENETLDQLLSRLIAEHDGIAPEEVTVEYIHNQRDKQIYPTARYDVGSRYGGYHATRLRVLTRLDLERIEKSADERLRQLAVETAADAGK